MKAAAVCTVAAALAIAWIPPVGAQVRSIEIAGFGDLTGPARLFGTNSRAALRAAVDSLNRAGGIRLSDGAMAHIALSYTDDHCNASDAINTVRRMSQSHALVAIGPTCSSVAESVYTALQRKAGDATDSGIEMPVFTDGAMKANLTRISQWAFRDAANERDMYQALWKWVHRQYPHARTVYGGEEGDFAHSHSTWQNIIRPEATTGGFTVVGQSTWSVNDTTFVRPATEMKAANADVLVLSAHPVTTCGVLREMRRQHVRFPIVIGLTSSATAATLTNCGALAEGMIIPTSFAPVTPSARRAAADVARAGGDADLHSMASWEIVMTLARVIGQSGIVGKTETIIADRERLRRSLAHLKEMDGLLGPIERTDDREARKPFVLVRATHSVWRVVFTSATAAP